MEYLIREERAEDVADIRVVNTSAFPTPSEADLVDALRSNGKIIVSLVAEMDGMIAGHILFTEVMIDPPLANRGGTGLAPMAVLPAFQNKGIGSKLVKAGLEQCRQRGYDFAVVLGHPGYYPRFGFIPASRFHLRCEYDAPDEAFMALELKPDALKKAKGTVRYQPEFAIV